MLLHLVLKNEVARLSVNGNVELFKDLLEFLLVTLVAFLEIVNQVIKKLSRSRTTRRY